MKALGIDYGTKNIGLAVSDDTGIIAGALGNIANYGELPAVTEIIKFIDLYKIDTVVLGFPCTYRPEIYEEGVVTKKIRRLKDYLEKHTKVKVDFWDESYSSKIVEKHLRGKAKKSSDSAAACFILQEYLDHHSMMRKLNEKN